MIKLTQLNNFIKDEITAKQYLTGVNIMMLKKLDKQSVLYLIIIIVIAVLVCAGVVYYLLSTEVKEPEEKISTGKNMRQILKTLGTFTPGEEGREVSEEVLENLGGSSEEGREIPEGVLVGLGTTPE